MNTSQALTFLSSCDQALRSQGAAWTSLDPSRTEATSLHDIAAACFQQHTFTPTRRELFTHSLSTIAQAQLEHFPETLFWDMDHLAWSLALTHHLPTLQKRMDSIAQLQNDFGRHSVLAFRYGHDFMYGFDWARWVRKDIAERHQIGPFDLAFLDYLHKRRLELIELIAENDSKYHQLPPGVARNPFSFSRTPQDELRLHNLLAQQGDIPVHAWTFDGHLSWDKDFRDVRAQKARALGIEKQPT